MIHNNHLSIFPFFVYLSPLFECDRGEPKNPKFWPRVCLRNKAKLAKEANTVRAVFESFFHYFNKGDLWSAQHGVAPAVLLDMQLLLEKFGIQFHQFSYKLLPLLLLQYFCLSW